ncbi:hypothetical protein WG907_16925 [Sphingobium sp. AN558]|uniref:hypothetical protein n=1 Tax=Sphingobium sp. AN558 TaxID=3133442 RepID=UPI0030C14448
MSSTLVKAMAMAGLVHVENRCNRNLCRRPATPALRAVSQVMPKERLPSIYLIGGQ